MKCSIITFFLLNSVIIKCQSYLVEITNTPFDTLVQYSSIANERNDAMEYPFIFEKDFELGFNFPYFDTNVNSIYCESTGVVDILGASHPDFFPMYLFAASTYELYEVFDASSYLKSDFRYKELMINNKKVLVIEFHRVSIDYDRDEIPFDSSDITFQYWFWENGDIELRFGEIFIDNSIFIPSKGYRYRSFEPDTYFPILLSIANLDNTEVIEVIGDINNFPTINYNGNNEEGLLYLPSKNTVVKFKKQISSSNETKATRPFPNVVVNILSIPPDFQFTEYRIFDLSGREIRKGNNTEIDLSFLQTGYYFIKLRDGGGMYSYKFLKQ